MGRIREILKWELREVSCFPRFELLIGVSLLACISQSPRSGFAGGPGLGPSVFMGFQEVLSAALHVAKPLATFQAIAFAALLPLTFGFETGEVELFLSYPIKRWELFLSKVSINLITIFALFSSSLTLSLWLTTPPEIFIHMPIYVLWIMLFMQSLFACSVTTLISMFAQHRVAGVLGSLVFLYGLLETAGIMPSPYSYMIPSEGSIVITDALLSFIRTTFLGVRSSLKYSPIEVYAAFIAPIVIALSLFIVALLYFRSLEIT